MNEINTTGNLRLSPYYLNTRRLVALTGAQIPIAAQFPLRKNSVERVLGMRIASEIANELLKSGEFRELTRELVKRDTQVDSMLAFVWTIFVFRGLSKALGPKQEAKSPRPATFSGEIPLGETDYKIVGELSNDHLFSQSSFEFLTGVRRALIAGEFRIDGASIRVNPYIIGDMLTDLSWYRIPRSQLHRTDRSLFQESYGETVRIFPQQIDAFAGMEFVPMPTRDQLKTLREIPENKIKNAFADIIGEPFVPKDWGGEKSDLSSSRLTLDQAPLSAAFIFKGPSVRGTLHPADMGKRGDQLVRVFDEPVDLVVIQHCDKIENSVVKLAEALAFYPRQPRRYCTIDGADTIRILTTKRKLMFGLTSGVES